MGGEVRTSFSARASIRPAWFEGAFLRSGWCQCGWQCADRPDVGSTPYREPIPDPVGFACLQLTLPNAAPSGITPARNPCQYGSACCRERRRRHVPELRPEGASWILARLADGAGTGVEDLSLSQQ